MFHSCYIYRFSCPLTSPQATAPFHVLYPDASCTSVDVTLPPTEVCWRQFHRRTSVDDVRCHRQTSFGGNFTDGLLWMTCNATDRRPLAAISPTDVCGWRPMPPTDVRWWQFHRRTSVDDVRCHRQTSVGGNFTNGHLWMTSDVTNRRPLAAICQRQTSVDDVRCHQQTFVGGNLSATDVWRHFLLISISTSTGIEGNFSW